MVKLRKYKSIKIVLPLQKQIDFSGTQQQALSAKEIPAAFPKIFVADEKSAKNVFP